MSGFTNMILISLVSFLTLIIHGYTLGPDCCNSISSNNACRHACEKLSTSESQLNQIHHIINTTHHCPPDLIEFWKCVNSSLSVSSEVTVWSGRPCCDLAVSRRCSESCRVSTSVEDLSSHCHRNTESNLYECMEKQTVGQKCCASVKKHTCRLVCQGTFLIQNLTRPMQRQILKRQCGGGSRQVMQCANDHVRPMRHSNPEESLHCCQKATDSVCKDTCIQTLRTERNNDEVVMEKLMESCGAPLPTDPMWACFLSPPQKEKPAITPAGDGACLQCCAKAVHDRCRSLCLGTCSDYNNYWKDFKLKCQDLTTRISVMEAPMLTCLAEAEEPCKFGCDGLDYCTNFNDRPTELFRSCNKRSNDAAREDVKLWKEGFISLPHLNLKIRVKNIEECEPEMWKAIACALQIKPCHKKPTPLSLCREDCNRILNKCVDHTRLAASQTVDVLCNALSPVDNHGSCISVTSFLAKSPYETQKEEVTNPCKGNPCGDGICWINRRKCRHECEPYVCHNACPMGGVTNVLVPRNAYVRIPEFQDSSKDDVCQAYRVCQCGKHNSLENCKLIPCLKKQSCQLGAQSPITGHGHVVKDHGSHFRIDCNYCICHSGELICTKHKCPPDKISSTWSGLPCDCSRHYSPRCGHNGKTYPNQCIATRCGSQGDVMHGRCTDRDPCESNPCGDGYKCMPKRQVCLSTTEMCLQYQCVRKTATDKCNHHHHDPVCDTTGEEFANPCLLLSHNKKLAYRGHCIKHCSGTSTVCGHNGETYPSDCAALADKTTVDYMGVCRAVGQFSGNITTSDCANIQCMPVALKDCRPITPPGGCCPICAAELRAVYSRALADVAAQAMNSEPLTVHSILEILSRHLTVAECDVFGYLSVEGDLVVLVATVTASPTVLQVQACIREAERIEYLIQTDSPTLMSYVALTPLLLAPVRTPVMAPLGSGVGLNGPSLLILLTTLLIYSITRTWI